MTTPPVQTVVALHGFTGGASSWDRVAESLPARIRVLALDLPGHAGWQGDLPTSFETSVDALADRIRRRKGRVHVVGYSLGARLALGLIVRRPDLFVSATLIGVRPGLDESEGRDRALRDDRLADELLRDGLEAFVDRWQSLPLFSSQQDLDPEPLAAQRRQRLSHDPEGLAWALRVLSPGRMPDYRRRLDAIRCPVHLMVGERDETFVHIAREFEVQVSGELDGHAEDSIVCEVEEVPGAGHNLPLEAPDAVARALARNAVRAADPELDSLRQPVKQPA